MTSTRFDESMLFSLMTLVDNHKKELTEGEYIKICNGLKACYLYHKWQSSSSSHKSLYFQIPSVENDRPHRTHHLGIKRLLKGLKFLFRIGQIYWISCELQNHRKKIENSFNDLEKE